MMLGISFEFVFQGLHVFGSLLPILLLFGMVVAYLFFPALFITNYGNRDIITQGKISRVIGDRQNSGIFREEISFKTRSGDIIRFVQRYYTGRPGKPGDSYRVIYDAGSPGEAMLYEPDSLVLIKIAGWVFISLGGFIFLMMLGSFYVKARCRYNLDAYYFWVNYLSGLAGDLLLAFPAALVWPFFQLNALLDYRFMELTDEQAATANWISLIFSSLGLITLIAVWFIAKWQ